MPVPAPHVFHRRNCLADACNSVGYQVRGALITRPSDSSTVSVSLATTTFLTFALEKLTPCLQQLGSLSFCNSHCVPHLAHLQTIDRSQAQRSQPQLCRTITFIHVDVGRFRTFLCVEIELIP